MRRLLGSVLMALALIGGTTGADVAASPIYTGLWSSTFTAGQTSGECVGFALDANTFCFADGNGSAPVALGVKFTTSAPVMIQGVRVYRVDGGAVSGTLWNIDGTQLATGSFAPYTGSHGWQDLIFSEPVAIFPGQTYVASYWVPTAYAFAYNYFGSPVTVGPITAVGSATNGTYCFSANNCFPNSSIGANYWVTPLWVANDPPTVDAGGPYTVDEGSSVTLTATGSDPEGQPLTYAWDLDNNGTFETSGQSVAFSAALLDGPNSYTVKVKATDPGALSATASTTVDVNNVAPTASAAFAASSVACGPGNATLNVTFTDPGVADTHTAVIAWGDGTSENAGPATSPFLATHTYAHAGTYTATVTVIDDDGGSGTATATLAVNFTTTGILQPINVDGTSVFRYGSTIPVKVRFLDCDGSMLANLAPTIKLTVLSGATPGTDINEPLSTSGADTSGVMRFATDQYLYNLASKPLPDPTATYRLTISVPSTGQVVTAVFGLKK